MFAGAAGMFLTTNNGSSWTAINNGLTDYGIRSIVINGPNIFVGTASSGVFLSNNNGGLWTAVSNGLPASSHIYSLALSGSSIFAGTSSVYLSSNNGSGWGNSGTGLPTSTTAQSLAISGSNIFASIVGTGGGVFKSINNGATWTMTGLSGGTNVYSLAIIGTYLFAGSLYGTVLVSSTNGSTWTLMNDGLPTNTVITSFAICGTDVFAGTSSSGVWKRPLSEITGIEENNNITDFMFYPNPSNGKFTFLENSGNINSIEICNMLGEIIHNISYSNQQISHEIDLSSYPKGIYLVKLYDGERIHLEKLVIQ